MPPKKNSTTNAAANPGKGSYRWTAENERTLLLLILGRGALGKSDCAKIAASLSPNVNGNAVRQRIGKLRAQQKEVCEKLGFELTEGGGAAGRKRKSSEEGDEGVKKARVRAKKRGGDEKVEDEGEGEVKGEEQEGEEEVGAGEVAVKDEEDEYSTGFGGEM